MFQIARATILGNNLTSTLSQADSLSATIRTFRSLQLSELKSNHCDVAWLTLQVTLTMQICMT